MMLTALNKTPTRFTTTVHYTGRLLGAGPGVGHY